MLRTIGVLSTICLLCVLPLQAQGLRAAPRPPAQAAGIPAGESAAPDGYAPIPAWLGQTRAPHPAKTFLDKQRNIGSSGLAEHAGDVCTQE